MLALSDQVLNDAQDSINVPSTTKCSSELELIAVEREYLYQLLRDGKLTDESRRRIERELDLEESSIFCKQSEAPPL